MKTRCVLPGCRQALALEKAGTGERTRVLAVCFPCGASRYIYFYRALYFSLWRQFNRNPICLLKHLACESFRKRKSRFIAIPGIGSPTLSPPSLPWGLPFSSPGCPRGSPPAPRGPVLSAAGPLDPLASSSWEGLLAEAMGRAGEIGSAGNVVCLLLPQLFAANK